MLTEADETLMRQAIAVARSRGSHPSTSPLGCVIVVDGGCLGADFAALY